MLYLQKSGRTTFTSGPVMKTMAFMTPKHSVIAETGSLSLEELGFVSVDGIKVKNGSTVIIDNISVSFQTTSLFASSSDFGMEGDDHIAAFSRLVFEESFVFEVFFVENGRNRIHPDQWLTKYPHRFLNFKAFILDSRRSPHGLLGQTARPLPHDKDRSIDDWKIEGNDSDYELKDGVMGKDFTFNKFLH